MDELKQLPLSLVDVAPGPGATRLTGTRLDGLADGVHTGGAWLFNKEVWKPTDCLPYPNCPYRVETSEVTALTALIGQPLFPKNWEYRFHNWRGWIVRPLCYIYGQNCPERLDMEQLLTVKEGLQNANRLGWVVGDEISVGLDLDYNLFVVDMSCATYSPTGDDEGRFWRYASLMGFTLLCDRRRAAMDMRFTYLREHKQLQPYIYGSYRRPLSPMWATKLPQDAHLVHNDCCNLITPHTWVLTKLALPEHVVLSYELTIACGPWRDKKTESTNDTSA